MSEYLPEQEWKVQIFHVQGPLRQQRILAAFSHIDRPGVVAVGARSGRKWYVVVEYCSYATEIHARRVVKRIDPSATQTYECASRRPGGVSIAERGTRAQ